MEEKTVDLKTDLSNIEKLINEKSPFNIVITIDKNNPYNSFIITVDKKAFKKYQNDIINDIKDYYFKNFKIKINLTKTKHKESVFKKDMILNYTIAI